MKLHLKRLVHSALIKPSRTNQRNILQKMLSVGEFATLVTDLKHESLDIFQHFRMQRPVLLCSLNLLATYLSISALKLVP